MDKDQIDLLKLEIEQEKLALDTERTRISRKSYHLDYFSKVGIPLAVFALAGVTYWTNKDYSERHFEFEKSVKSIELQQKNDDIFQQKDKASRESEHEKSAFLQNHFEEITTGTVEKLEVLKASVPSTFIKKEDQLDVLARIDQLHRTAAAYLARTNVSSPAAAPTASVSSDSPTDVNGASQSSMQAAANYAAYGRALLNKGSYDQAAANFEIATVLNPSDPSAWNSLGYAQLRSGRADAAYNSIAAALNLHPADAKTQNFATINATKILCALGRRDEGENYLNTALSALPSLHDMASKDSEIKRYCGFSVS